MGNFLVIGGSGVMGTVAVQAIREAFGFEAYIIGNWYGKEDPEYKIEGADYTLYGDITQSSCLKSINAIKGNQFDYLFYATAMGDVGFPIKEATQEQINRSNSLSFDPLPILEESFQIGTIVTYSTFYLLKHQLCSYGAMGHSKEKIEKWVLELNVKSKRTCIRAGLFESHSSRAIKLLLRKNAKAINKETNPLLGSYFDGIPPSKGIKLFEEGIRNEETETYGDSSTTLEALKNAHLKLFHEESAPFVNVCGERIWVGKDPLLLKGNLEK